MVCRLNECLSVLAMVGAVSFPTSRVRFRRGQCKRTTAKGQEPVAYNIRGPRNHSVQLTPQATALKDLPMDGLLLLDTTQDPSILVNVPSPCRACFTLGYSNAPMLA